jgi:hypothetical protein
MKSYVAAAVPIAVTLLENNFTFHVKSFELFFQLLRLYKKTSS